MQIQHHINDCALSDFIPAQHAPDSWIIGLGYELEGQGGPLDGLKRVFEPAKIVVTVLTDEEKEYSTTGWFRTE